MYVRADGCPRNGVARGAVNAYGAPTEHRREVCRAGVVTDKCTRCHDFIAQRKQCRAKIDPRHIRKRVRDGVEALFLLNFPDDYAHVSPGITQSLGDMHK